MFLVIQTWIRVIQSHVPRQKLIATGSVSNLFSHATANGLAQLAMVIMGDEGEAFL